MFASARDWRQAEFNLPFGPAPVEVRPSDPIRGQPR